MGMYDRDWYKDSPRNPNWFSELHPVGKVLLVAFGIALAVVAYFRFTNPNRGREDFPDANMLDELRARVQEQAANASIHTAAENGDVGRVAQLLTADPSLVHSLRRKDIPDQPLHVAALAGNRHVADLLLRYGADVNARGDQGMTPLHCAALNGNLDVAELLLKRGANPSLKDDAGETALQIASRIDDDPDSVKLADLLRRKSDKR
jgi:ankyrin repeat protein